MKLDKLTFAKLVAYIVRLRPELELDVYELDTIIDIPAAEQRRVYPDADAINDLMALMAQGTRKIEAIKLHRQLTGYGLKESKDEVERHWIAKPVQSEDTLSDILQSAKRRD